jgi:hypothetical protein
MKAMISPNSPLRIALGRTMIVHKELADGHGQWHVDRDVGVVKA